MKCEDIALILDNGNMLALERDVRSGVERHLADCPVCARIWNPVAQFAKVPVPPVPAGFAGQCAALVVAESQLNGKRRAHIRLVVLGCLVAGAAAAGILTLHLSGGGSAGSHQSVAFLAPVSTPGSTSVPSVTVNQRPTPGDVVPTSASAMSSQLKPEDNERSKSSPDGCAGRPERVAALPGIAGFELPRHMFSSQVMTALAAESRDPVWASDMERQISEALQKKAGLHPSRVETVCRMTICGVLLAYQPQFDSAELDEQEALANEVRESLHHDLGFHGRGTVTMDNRRCEGTRFTLFYMDGARGAGQSLTPMAYQFAPAWLGTPGLGTPTAAPPVVEGLSTEGRLLELLATEPVDRSPEAVSMEAALKREASAVAGERWSQILVECRGTTCGIVLAYPRSAGPDDGGMIANRLVRVLAPAFGTSVQTSTTASGDFMTIHLRLSKRPLP